MTLAHTKIKDRSLLGKTTNVTCFQSEGSKFKLISEVFTI